MIFFHGSEKYSTSFETVNKNGLLGFLITSGLQIGSRILYIRISNREVEESITVIGGNGTQSLCGTVPRTRASE